MIDKISNNQMIGISTGLTALGAAGGYAVHHSQAKEADKYIKNSVYEQDAEAKRTIKAAERETLAQCQADPVYSEKIQKLLKNSGKKSVYELSLKEVLNPEDYEEYNRSKNNFIAQYQIASDDFLASMKKEFKHNKAKKMIAGGTIGLAISSIVPIVKYIKKKKTNENSTNNNNLQQSISEFSKK